MFTHCLYSTQFQLPESIQSKGQKNKDLCESRQWKSVLKFRGKKLEVSIHTLKLQLMKHVTSTAC